MGSALREREGVVKMPLTAVEGGRRVRLVAVEGGSGLRGRLAAMGLLPGVEIEVLRQSAHGPFLIGVRGGRILLGRGMARKVTVA
jgi:ferrous iron transport protein A